MSSRLKVVDIGPPPTAAAIVTTLKKLLVRARAGEFETIFIVGLSPDGKWMTAQSGRRLDSLRTVGVLESIKADVLIASETDETSGV
jgi:hypothetical protein